ncbi:hypothetical protein PILCRDRAFT_319919 [Piloderma croceum F 1598]|uniref:Uncharacterized protein n=1 Tax=Piloderma croceum (strain F 1598) TaxID=765440 RepID=A0A0C3FQ39_PILCF|nr:hypothetical protein PILCRDRAFT_319919 [Piloderma croceum F 1598]
MLRYRQQGYCVIPRCLPYGEHKFDLPGYSQSLDRRSSLSYLGLRNIAICAAMRCQLSEGSHKILVIQDTT